MVLFFDELLWVEISFYLYTNRILRIGLQIISKFIMSVDYNKISNNEILNWTNQNLNGITFNQSNYLKFAGKSFVWTFSSCLFTFIPILCVGECGQHIIVIMLIGVLFLRNRLVIRSYFYGCFNSCCLWVPSVKMIFFFTQR